MGVLDWISLHDVAFILFSLALNPQFSLSDMNYINFQHLVIQAKKYGSMLCRICRGAAWACVNGKHL